ncbi:MAG: glycosyltransferase N-terminal domain-containing protein [Phycisphaerales bacterium]
MNLLDPLYAALALATAPWWARKARGGWAERFGRIGAVGDRAGADGGRMRRLLIHTVSVGETAAVRELVPLLTPHAQVIVSATTDTGLKRARELYGASCDVVRYPLDASWAVRRFLDATRPDAVALVELEVWPNFLAACRRRGIPACIINGRLSERSFRGYRRLRPFLRRMFGSLAFVGAQDEAYAGRFRQMGVAPEQCRVTGSMKWDTARIEDEVPGADGLAREMGIARGPGAPPLVVAGSTAEGEEALLHAACPPGVQLLCAPRKPERFDEAAAALPGCVRRSSPTGGTPVPPGTVGAAAPARFLLDTIGELRRAYALADIAVIGRTFGGPGGEGGSDPIEPIGLGKATVVGPAAANFAAIIGTFERGGGLVRVTRETLGPTLARLLADGAERERLAARGRDVIREHQGASRRHAGMLLELLGIAAPPMAPGGRCSSGASAAPAPSAPPRPPTIQVRP